MYEHDDRNGQLPGQNEAVISLVLGIIAVILWFFGYSSIISIVLAIVGLVYASKSKQLGYNGPMRTAGFVLSLIALIGGALIFIACVACIGTFGLASFMHF